jgi:hypothetical protein
MIYLISNKSYDAITLRFSCTQQGLAVMSNGSKKGKGRIIQLNNPIIDHRISQLIAESIATEDEDAEKSGNLGFMARALVQACMPHKNVKEPFFKRTNGNYSLVMTANPDIGLPYGSIPRLELIWITTEAVKRKSREIILGNSLSSFMSELGIPRTGAYIGRFKDQTKRLFSCSISCTYDDGNTWQIENVKAVKRASLTWAPEEKKDPKTHQSILLLDQDFFDEIISRPVPIDLNAIKNLKNSSLALDIYSWLTYRMSYLNKRTCIPWEALHNQFGSNYAPDKSGRYAFKKKFSEQMVKVLALYPDARVEKEDTGLLLYPSKTHVSKKLPVRMVPKKEIPLIKVTTNKKKVDKESEKKYETYKLDKLVNIMQFDVDDQNQKAILSGFTEYLARRKLSRFRFTNAKQLIKSNKAVKQHLYNYVNSHWTPLLDSIKSVEEFEAGN